MSNYACSIFAASHTSSYRVLFVVVALWMMVLLGLIIIF